MIIPQNIIDLVNLAICDNNITIDERKIIIEAAKREGISEEEINEYINTALKQHFNSQPKDDLLYCEHCGNSVIPSYGDCPFCGNKIISLSQQTQKETTTRSKNKETSSKNKETYSKPKETSSWKKRYEISNSHRISPKTIFLIATTILSITLKFVVSYTKDDKKQKTTYKTEYTFTKSPSESKPTVTRYRFTAPPQLYSTGEYYDELSLSPKLPIATLQPLSNETADLINDEQTRSYLGYKTIYIYLRESENPSLEITKLPMYNRENQAKRFRLTITDTLGKAIIGLPYFDFEAHYDNMIDMIDATIEVANKKDKKKEIIHRLRNLQANYSDMRYTLTPLY